AASDTIGDTERGFVDKEVQQLKTEINRIAQSTEYNGHRLLNGEGERLEFQVGLHNNPDEDRFIFDASKINASTERLGVTGVSVATKQDAQNGLDVIDEALKTLNGNRAELGAMQNRIQSTINNIAIYHENLSAANSRIRDD